MSNRKGILLSRTSVVILKSVVTGAVLWFLFTMVSPSDLLLVWEKASWPWIAAALVLVPLHIMVRAIRWRRLLIDAGESEEAGRAVRTVLVGYAFAVTTPAEVGEVAARVKLHHGVAGSKILGLVLVEKVLHSYLILLPGLPAIALFVWEDPLISWLIAGVIIALFFVAIAITPRLRSVSFDERSPRLGPIARTIRAIGSIRRTSFASLGLATMGIFLVYVVQEYLVLNAIVDLGFVETWNGFWAGMGVRTLAPFFIMDLGIREASHVYFFGRFGIDASSAMAVSFLMFTLNILLPSLVGLGLMFRKDPKTP